MRRLRWLAAIAGVLFVALAVVAPRPAQAQSGWGSVLPGACDQGICASKEAVCEFWGNFYGHWPGDLTPIYNNGRIVAWHCTAVYWFNNSSIDIYPTPYCSAGFSNASTGSGCSLLLPPNPKLLGVPVCNKCVGVVGNPINGVIGNKFEVVTDYASAGPQQLAFVRAYNSQGGLLSSLGLGWQSNFDRRVLINGAAAAGTATSVNVVRPDGSSVAFAKGANGWATVETDMDGRLTTDGATVWTFTGADDSVDTFDFASGRLLSTRARGGYLQTLAYDTAGQLASVTDSYGRALAFTFANGVLATMTDPDGGVYAYSYDTVMTSLASTPNRLLQVTYPGAPPAPAVQYVYENTTYPFALTGLIDEAGNRFASWSYDAGLNAVSSQHAGGAEQTTVAYDLMATAFINKLWGTFTVTDALGKQTIYTDGWVGSVGKAVWLDEQASPNSPATRISFSFDANGNIASRTDKNGNVTTFANDAHGQVLTRTEASGTALARVTTTTYHPSFRLPTQIVEPGRTTTFTYDAVGNLSSKVETDTTGSGATRVWDYTWSATGQMLTATDPLNNTTTYVYDSSGALVSVTNALGQATQVTSHDASGRPLTVVDPNGLATTLAYDPRGRLISATVLSAGGNAVTTIAYDATGNVTEITQPDGSFLAYAYDAAHRLTRVSNAFDERIDYTLDAMGNRTQTQIHSSGGTSLEKTQSQVFDELGRLLRSIGAAGQATSYAYDFNGNPTGITDPLSHTTSQSFDALDRLIHSTAPLSATTSYGYDAQDHTTGVTDPRGLITSYGYDGLDDLLQQSSPDTGVTAYQVDAAGNRTQQTDAAGNVVQMSYDALGRLTARTYPNDPAENVTYSYDQPSGGFGIGRLTGVTDQSGSTAYVYDDRGNVVQETRVIGGVSYVTTYAHDLANHLAQMIYPSGRIVTYSRDGMGRIVGVATQTNSAAPPVTVASGATYLPFGPLASLAYGNGLSLSIQYDQDYRPSTRTVSGTGVVQSLAYGFDPASDITAIADNATSARSQTFQYDALQRLTQASGVYGTLSYGYDAVGNRTAQVGGTANLAESYGYAGDSNRLLSVANGGTTRLLGYTPTGNLAANDNGAGSVVSFSYDQANRLVQVANQSTLVAIYQNNFIGERVAKNAAGVITHFHYDRAGRLTAESDAAGNALREHLWLADMPAGFVAGGTLYFVHPDHLNTPQRITDAGQTVVWDIALAPFGGVAQLTPSLIDNLRFPGQYADAETGLSYNYFRDYDPSIGRYVESDPIGLGGGANTYAYVRGNPQRYTDPTGLVLNPAEGACLAGPNPICLGGVIVDAATWVALGVVAAADAILLLRSPAGSKPSNVINNPALRRQAEYDRVKNYCDSPPEEGDDECSNLSRQIDHAEKCASLYNEWDSIWAPGRHMSKIGDWNRRCDNLKKRHSKMCTKQ